MAVLEHNEDIFVSDLTKEEMRQRYIESMPTYQRYDAMKLVREAARLLKREGDMIIYRDAFRWKNDSTDAVLPNHYESFSLRGLAEDFHYEVIHDFHHVAVVRSKSEQADGDRNG